MATEMKTKQDNLLLAELEKQETQEVLVSLLQKLPELERNLESAANLIDFGKSVLEDEKTVNTYDSIVRTYSINGETLEALVQLLEKLPKLVQLVEQLENIIDFVTDILQDDASLDYVTKNVEEYAAPLLEKKIQGQALWAEIQEKVKEQDKPIKLTTILKWLKDPNVQTGLKYINATLQVLNNKNK